MTITPSFMSANYVCEQIGYSVPAHQSGGTEWWGMAEAAVQDHYRPVETYADRFETLVQRISGAGFSTMDLWLGHLHPSWATDEHIDIATTVLARNEMQLASLAGGFGETREEFLLSCRLANAVGAPVLGGFAPLLQTDRGFVIDTLGDNGLVLGLENHPEKNPQEVRNLIGDPTGGVVGSLLDTGWFGTQGYDSAMAARELADVIVYVHLKDIVAQGGHKSCRFGDGVVPLESTIRALVEDGYTGPVSIEHEPEDHDPTDDVASSAETLRTWLAAS